MSKPHTERQSVISQETFEILEELLEFRHVFNNIYGEELIYERTKRNAKQMGELFNRLSKELDAFIAYLKKYESN